MSRSPSEWLAERHSLGAEAVLVVGLYAVYETSRGLVAGGSLVALHHARMIASLERSLHVFVEANVQHAARALPGLIGTLGLLYLTMHLAVTGTYLLWLHRRRPAAFPLVRTAVLIASGLALIGYVAFPTAPPRLAALGIADTISGDHVDLNHGLLSSLYNPFAAVPSMHVGYAIIVGASLVRHGGRRVLRAAGVLYPALVVLVIVATGNHFLFDAAVGVLVAAVAAGAAQLLVSPREQLGHGPLHEFGWPRYQLLEAEKAVTIASPLDAAACQASVSQTATRAKQDCDTVSVAEAELRTQVCLAQELNLAGGYPHSPGSTA